MNFVDNIKAGGKKTEPDPSKMNKKIKKRKTAIPSLPEYSSSKIFLDKDFLKAFLQHDVEFFLKTKNYQRNYMKKLPKLLWTYEKDHNIGDFALLFLNPDSELFEENMITSKDALALFYKLTETSYDYHQKDKFLKVLRQAFTEAFLDLPEGFEGDQSPTKKLKKNIEKITSVVTGGAVHGERRKSRAAHLNKQDINDPHKKYDDYKEDGEEANFIKRMDVQAGQEISQNGKSKEGKETGDLEIKEEKEDNMFKTGVEDGSIKFKKFDNADALIDSLEEDNKNDENEVGKDSLKGEEKTGIKEEGEGEGEDNQGNVIEYAQTKEEETVKEDSKAVYADRTKRQAEKATNKQNDEIYKQLGNGGFYLEDDDGLFHKSPKEVADFMTLVRQLVYVILAYHGIVIREFVTSDGKFITAVCYGYIQNMHTIAEVMHMRKKVDLSIVDLLSLEPIDSRSRPLRMNEVLWSKTKWEDVYGVETELSLFYALNNALGNHKSLVRKKGDGTLNDMLNQSKKKTSVDFHTLARKCKGTLDKIDHMKADYVSDIIDHAHVPLSVWRNYLEFVTTLADRVGRIDDKYEALKKRLQQKYLSFTIKEEEEIILPETEDVEETKKKKKKKKGKEEQRNTIRTIRNKIKVLRKHITGNRSTYKIKQYKLSKQLGTAYAVG